MRVYKVLLCVVSVSLLLLSVVGIRPRVQHAIQAFEESMGMGFPFDEITMKETQRTESTVTYSRTKGDSITSITMNLAPTYGNGKNKDHSLLSTKSKVGGACAKPMCKTVGPWQKKCIESVCYPLCLGTVFDVTVEGAGEVEEFVSQLAEPVHQNAIQGVLLGIGCSEHTGCCPKDARLATWTESKLQGANQYGLPLPYCKHTKDREAACAACKATVTVKPKGDEICEHHYKPMEIGAAEAAFGRAGLASTPPAHKSFKEKCKEVDAEVQGAKGDMEEAFNGYVCGCLGCCDDQECPYKVAFSTVEEAEGVNGGTGQEKA